jgi:hypothetical protein
MLFTDVVVLVDESKIGDGEVRVVETNFRGKCFILSRSKIEYIV